MSDRVVPTIEAVAERTRADQRAVEALNLDAGIEWGTREQIRAIQGHYSKIEDICVALLSSLGTDEALATLEWIWGPLDED